MLEFKYIRRELFSTLSSFLLTRLYELYELVIAVIIIIIFFYLHGHQNWFAVLVFWF